MMQNLEISTPKGEKVVEQLFCKNGKIFIITRKGEEFILSEFINKKLVKVQGKITNVYTAGQKILAENRK